MKKIIVAVILVLCIIGSMYLLRRDDIKEIYDSLVYIESIGDEEIISGSGFVYKIEDKKNYILTNYHVIYNNKNIVVYNKNKQKTKATVDYIDKINDIAIISIEDKLNLKAAKIGDFSKVKNGDTVYAIGCPDNIKNFGTITKGKIEEIHSLTDIFDVDLMKLNIKTTYGNSGGPLLNTNGEVIGITTLKEDGKDISYAIPINFVLK